MYFYKKMSLLLLLVAALFNFNALAAETPLAADAIVHLKTDDAAITKGVEQLIQNSETLSKLNVHVDTDKGVVKLSGNTDSASQADLLITYAQSIYGVNNVDTSGLTIGGSTAPLKDAYITAKIKGLLAREKLFGEKDVAAINTQVETVNGVVYLTGVIDNKAQIDNAIQIIRAAVPEVSKIEYHVHVQP